MAVRARHADTPVHRSSGRSRSPTTTKGILHGKSLCATSNRFAPTPVGTRAWVSRKARQGTAPRCWQDCFAALAVDAHFKSVTRSVNNMDLSLVIGAVETAVARWCVPASPSPARESISQSPSKSSKLSGHSAFRQLSTLLIEARARRTKAARSTSRRHTMKPAASNGSIKPSQPENRLVPVELEKRWNGALTHAADMEQRLVEASAQAPQLTAEQRRQPLSLGRRPGTTLGSSTFCPSP